MEELTTIQWIDVINSIILLIGGLGLIIYLAHDTYKRRKLKKEKEHN